MKVNLQIKGKVQVFELDELLSLSPLFNSSYTSQLNALELLIPNASFHLLHMLLRHEEIIISEIPQIIEFSHQISAMCPLFTLLKNKIDCLSDCSQLIMCFKSLDISLACACNNVSKPVISEIYNYAMKKLISTPLSMDDWKLAFKELGVECFTNLIESKINEATTYEDVAKLVEIYQTNTCFDLYLILSQARKEISTRLFMNKGHHIECKTPRYKLTQQSLQIIYDDARWNVLLNINDDGSIGILIKRVSDFMPYRTFAYNGLLKGKYRLFGDCSIYSFPANWQYLFGPPAAYLKSDYDNMNEIVIEVFFYESILHGAILSYLSTKICVEKMHILHPRDIECMIEGLPDRNEDQTITFICSYLNKCVPCNEEVAGSLLKCIRLNNVTTKCLLDMVDFCPNMYLVPSFKRSLKNEMINRASSGYGLSLPHSIGSSVFYTSVSALPVHMSCEFYADLADYFLKEKITGYIDSDTYTRYKNMSKQM